MAEDEFDLDELIADFDQPINFAPQNIEPEIHISEDGWNVKLKGDAESFTVEKDGEEVEPEIHISEDGWNVKLKGDAESFTVEKDGEEVEINFQDGEWHISGGNEDRDTCSHRYVKIGRMNVRITNVRE